MEKGKESGAPATQRGRRPSGVAGASPCEDRGRWSSRRKTEVVLRILRGEDLDALSRELGVTAGRLAAWRDEFLAAGQAAFKSRTRDGRADEIGRLRRKVGELTMDLELYEAWAERVDPALRPLPRRPRA